ncbi:hypothetical protein MRB53_035227 [Persea americana]|uniref:Uncharacterized protein n=1 Tax=Persea americana TaxID=3435 RepID=A0ACC2K451_PERAE|nr:hypothetical protein MRB53_035227 [Persea americana]
MGRENTSSRRICAEEVSSSSSNVIDPLSEISCDVAEEEHVLAAEIRSTSGNTLAASTLPCRKIKTQRTSTSRRVHARRKLAIGYADLRRNWEFLESLSERFLWMNEDVCGLPSCITQRSIDEITEKVQMALTTLRISPQSGVTDGRKIFNISSDSDPSHSGYSKDDSSGSEFSMIFCLNKPPSLFHNRTQTQPFCDRLQLPSSVVELLPSFFDTGQQSSLHAAKSQSIYFVIPQQHSSFGF